MWAASELQSHYSYDIIDVWPRQYDSECFAADSIRFNAFNASQPLIQKGCFKLLATLNANAMHTRLQLLRLVL